MAEAPIDPRYVMPEDLTEKDLLHALWKDVRTLRIIAQVFFGVWIAGMLIALTVILVVAGEASL